VAVVLTYSVTDTGWDVIPTITIENYDNMCSNMRCVCLKLPTILKETLKSKSNSLATLKVNIRPGIKAKFYPLSIM